MNVLFLARNQTDLTIGGIFEVIYQLSQFLPLLGVKVSVYAGRGQTEVQAKDYFGNGTPCYTGPMIKPGWLNAFTHSSKLKPIIQIIQENKIDFIHTCGVYRAGFMAMEIKRKINLPFVATSHGDVGLDVSERLKRKSVIKRYRSILKAASRVTHLTSHMAALSHQLCDTQYKSDIIPNGIDLSVWKEKASPNQPNYLFAIGRLVEGKGFDVMIQSFSLLLQSGVSTSLVIAGEGYFKEKLIAQCHLLHLKVVSISFDADICFPENTVCFVGNVRGENKVNLFMQSRLVLFPTQPSVQQESFGLVPFEAFAAKKYLLMSDLIRANALRKEGFQFEIVTPSDSPDAWASKIKEILGKESEGDGLYNHNLQLLKPYDWQTIAKQYQKVYERCLSSL